MDNYRILIASILAFTMISNTGCSSKKECSRHHMEDYYLENVNTNDDFIAPTIENILSTKYEDFLTSIDTFNDSYIYDERIEIQFERIEGLKYINNNAMRIVLQKFIEDFETTLNTKLREDQITYILKKYIKDDLLDTMLSILFKNNEREYSYQLLKNELGYNVFVIIRNEEILLHSGSIITTTKCKNNKNKTDYNISDIYLLQSPFDEEKELAIFKIDNTIILSLCDGPTKTFNAKNISENEYNEIINLMKEAVISGQSFKEFLKQHKELLSTYFDEGVYEEYLRNIQANIKFYLNSPKNSAIL